MRDVARSVDAPPALIPVLPRLFKGLDGLGCMAITTARLLKAAGVGSRSRVIDVGCGKGAVAVELAKRTGCRVVGIDACEAFVEAAQSLAERRGVAQRCEFRAGDLHELARPSRRCDAAIMLNVRPLEEAVPLVRAIVRPGGLYAIDDVVLTTRSRSLVGVSALKREEARALITSTGDAIVCEFVPSAARVARLNRSLHQRIALNARAIGRERPALRSHLREFLRRLREANRQLTGPIRPAIWVVRRSAR